MNVILFYLFGVIILKLCLSQNWIVSVKHKDTKDFVALTAGVYSNIEITFEKKASKQPSNIKGSLLLSDSSLYQLASNEILFDTEQSTKYNAYIGITCKADESGTAKRITLSLITKDTTQQIDSTPFKIQYIFTPTPNQVIFSLSNPYVSFGIPESFKLKDALFNVDPLIIQFQPKATNSKYAYIDSKLLINKFPFPSDFKGNYGITQFDYIVYQQEFTPSVIDSICFTIDHKITFSLSHQSLKELNDKVKADLKKTQLIPSSLDNTIRFKVPISLIPSILSCAVFCVPSVDITDNDIRNRNFKTYKTKELQYYQQYYYSMPKEENKQLMGNPEFKGLSRLCPLRMKCILDTNEEQVLTKDNFKSSSIIFGRTKLADIKEQVYGNIHSLITTNCNNWVFNNKIDKNKFYDKAILYCDFRLKSTLGCTKCNYRGNANEKIASICVIPDEACETNYKGIMANDFKVMIDSLSTGQKIKENLGLDEQEYAVSSIQIESDFFPIEDNTITSVLKEKTVNEVILEITNKNQRPIECYPRLISKDSYLDIYEEEFLNDEIIGVIEGESKATLKIPYESQGQFQSMYNIYINCLNLPNFQHYFHNNYKNIASFYLPFIPLPKSTEELLPDCKKDMKKIQCKITSKAFPSTIENILIEMDQYKTYRLLSQNEQLNVIYEGNISIEEKSKDDLLNLALMLDYMNFFDCMKYSNFTECREIKINSLIAIYKNAKLKYTNCFVNESMTDLRYYYSFVLYFMSMNSDSFNQETAKEFIEVICKYIDNNKNILKEDSKILLLFNGIMNNIIDLIDYMYIDGFITDAPTSESTQMYTNSTIRKKVKSHLEELARINKEIGLTTFSYSNYIYNVHQLDKTSTKATEFINVGLQSVNVTIPLKELIATFKVDYLTSILYTNYPLRGYNNTKVHSEVVSIKAYDEYNSLISVSDLKEPFKIRYNKLKTNNTHLLYCGYLNEDTWDIDNKGMTNTEDENKTLICESNHFTDFLVNDTSRDNLQYLWWVIPLSVLCSIGLIIGLAYLIKCFLSKTQKKKNETLNAESDKADHIMEIS